MHAVFRKSVSVVASIALALALVPAAALVQPVPQAEAASAPTLTITRAATGKLTIKKGAKYKLAAQKSAGKLTYKTSKKKVVKVTKKGVLKAVKPGKATVTVTAKAGAKKTVKKVAVTVVKKNKFKKVKKLTAKAGATSLTVGKTTKVTATFNPKKASNKNVTYRSSKPAVATVNAYGKVTAKKAGTVAITVTSCDNAKAKAKVAIKVKAKATTDYYQPEITRGEFAADLCNALDLEKVDDEDISPYRDLYYDSNASSIRALWSAGAFGSTNSSYFDPDSGATRGFCAVTAARALGYSDDGTTLDCEDSSAVDSSEQALAAIAIDENLIQLSAGYLNPNSDITGSDEASLISTVQAKRQLGSGEEVCEVDYADDVVTASGDVTLGETDDNGKIRTASVSISDGTEPQAGDVLVIDPTDNVPTGTVLKVDSVNGNVASGKLVEDPSEVLDDLKLKANNVTASDDSLFFPADGVEVEGAESTGNDKGLSNASTSFSNGNGSFKFKDGSITAKIKLKKEQDGNDSGEITVSAKITPKFDLDADLGEGKFDVQATTDLKVALEGSVSYDKEVPMGGAYLMLPAGFCVVANLDLHIRVDGSIELSVKATNVTTLNIGQHTSFSSKVKDTHLELNAQAKLKVGPELDFVFCWLSVELYDVGVEVGMAAKVDATLRPTGMVCKDSGTWLYLEVFTGRSCTTIFDLCRKVIPQMPTFKCDWELLGEDNSPVKHMKHYEDNVEVAECTYGGTDEGIPIDPNPAVDPNIDAQPSDTDIANGTFGTCAWRITADGCLVVGPGTLLPNTQSGEYFWPWRSYCEDITSVQFSEYVSLAGNASHMFQDCYNLTSISGLAKFNVSGVTDMALMFYGCNQLTDLSVLASWDVSSVENMDYMFADCSSVTSIGPLSEWNVSNVKIMRGMFEYSDFSSLDALSTWDVSKVQNMSGMFERNSALADISGASSWNVSNVTDMGSLFSNCESLPNLDALTKWDTSSVENMSYMFVNCFDLANVNGASSWNVSNVTSMSNMFYGCSTLGSVAGMSNWIASSLESADCMFYECASLTDISGLSKLIVAGEKDLSSMFYGCSSITSTAPLSSWNVAGTTNTDSMFYGCEDLPNVSGLSTWNVSNVESMGSMFYGCSSIENVNGLSQWTLTNLTEAPYLFYGCTSLSDISGLSSWKMPELTSTEQMFRLCTSLISVQALSSWDMSGITDTYGMFLTCSSLASVSGLSKWNVSNVENMGDMFGECASLTSLSGLANWNVSSVTDMSSLFYNCSDLSNISAVANWKVGNVTSMVWTFSGCSSLTDLGSLSSWNVSNVESMQSMFRGCTDLQSVGALSGWDVDSVNDISYMFSSCTSLEDASPLSSWSLSSDVCITRIFQNCTSLTKYPSWYPTT